MRVENELKLTVPNEIETEVWNFLQNEYSSEDLYLNQSHEGFAAALSEELFIDVYFDVPSRELIKMQSGIRYRSRYLNPEAIEPDKELMQIKVSEGEGALSRSEIKFPVKHYDEYKKKYDDHSVIGLVKRGDRDDFIKRVEELGLVPEDLEEVVELRQDRRRVYISKEEESFATITLDHVTATAKQPGSASAEFIEIEMELNEIKYTDASEEERAEMEAINEEIKAHLLEKFPEIIQDQTPKYNKAFEALGIEVPDEFGDGSSSNDVKMDSHSSDSLNSSSQDPSENSASANTAEKYLYPALIFLFLIFVAGTVVQKWKR